MINNSCRDVQCTMYLYVHDNIINIVVYNICTLHYTYTTWRNNSNNSAEKNFHRVIEIIAFWKRIFIERPPKRVGVYFYITNSQSYVQDHRDDRKRSVSFIRVIHIRYIGTYETTYHLAPRLWGFYLKIQIKKWFFFVTKKS